MQPSPSLRANKFGGQAYMLWVPGLGALFKGLLSAVTRQEGLLVLGLLPEAQPSTGLPRTMQRPQVSRRKAVAEKKIQRQSPEALECGCHACAPICAPAAGLPVCFRCGPGWPLPYPELSWRFYPTAQHHGNCSHGNPMAWFLDMPTPGLSCLFCCFLCSLPLRK